MIIEKVIDRKFFTEKRKKNKVFKYLKREVNEKEMRSVIKRSLKIYVDVLFDDVYWV